LWPFGLFAVAWESIDILLRLGWHSAIMPIRVSFALDPASIHADMTLEHIHQFVIETLVLPARRAAKNALHEVRRDSATNENDKAVAMAVHLKAITLTMIAENNLRIEEVRDDA
jgi:hypothetical protein